MEKSERIKLARIELAKRELARRNSSPKEDSSDQGEQGVWDATMQALGSRPELQPYGAPSMPEGGFGPLEAAQQTLAAPLRVGQTLAAGPAKVGELVSEGTGYSSQRLANKFGARMTPGVEKLVDYSAATAGMMVANLPFMLKGGDATKYTTELAPASGKPGLAARFKQMRTGVEASEFERLRRDPSAFFDTTSRAEVGREIGKAKAEAGINLGVTNDPSSLTMENLKKARSPVSMANKAQDRVVAKLNIDKMRQDPNLSLNDAISGEMDAMGEKITPDDVSTALKGINIKLSRLERLEGRGSPNFQQWTAIKSHFQNLLEELAPQVKQKNQEFSRLALRDKFMEPFPVNQAGTMSKISAFGGAPLMGGVGALVAGGPGAVIGGVGYQAARSPFVAGLGTAVRGLADKALDPILTGAIRDASQRAIYGAFIDRLTTKED